MSRPKRNPRLVVTTPEARPEVWSGAMKMANRGPRIPLDQEPPDWYTGREWNPPKAETCLREFCFELAVWAKVKSYVPALHPPRSSVRPYCDGSGVWWEIRDQSTGHAVWWIEAADWRGALAEKRRLCHAYGWKPSWAMLFGALGPGEAMGVA